MNIKEIFTILLIINFRIINEDNTAFIYKQANGLYTNQNYLTKENFKTMKFWFENYSLGNRSTFFLILLVL